MKVEKIKIGKLDCKYCSSAGSRQIAWLLYPLEVADEWISRAVEKYGTSIAVITGMDWDNDLTPWPAPGVPKGSPDFQGRAAGFLEFLSTQVLPAVESRLACGGSPERTLIGVSLSGLFTLWQWSQCNLFKNIATLSGSYWYPGFAEWIERRDFSKKEGRCFMLLGDAESRSGNRLFATVGKCTDDIVGYLHRQGVDVSFHMVRGNHYQYPAERLEMAMAAIFHS